MNDLLFIVFILAATAGAFLARKLTLAASLTGGLLGLLIYSGVGWTGVFLMSAFFLVGTATTSWQKKVKQSIGLAQENKGRRNTGQVLANGGVAGLMGLMAVLLPGNDHLFLFLTACAFSSATADTVSSELGSVYGKRFYDILSFRQGQRGPDGMISLEGLLCGLAGSCLIAAIYALAKGWSLTFLWIVVAGTTGNLADSFLGATAERKGIIRNDAVNFLNTLAGALTGFLCHYF